MSTDIMARLEELASLSDSADDLTRPYLSPAHRKAADLVLAWMGAAGMSAAIDAVGNVVGRYEGAKDGRPALLLGSHIDTVRNAGKYDGALGVVIAIACVQQLHDAGERLPFAVEVVAFGDEEGVRFPSTLRGSRALAGAPVDLDETDDDGTTVAAALRAFGGDPDAIPGVARSADAVLGFVEVHIEQGPVLEAKDVPVGVVTSIAGATRGRVTFTGVAGHAGTVPMSMRKDALAAAAHAIVAIEERCSAAGLVGTVGRISAEPGAVNVIPGSATFTFDIRAGDDTIRARAIDDVRAACEKIGGDRGITVAFEVTHASDACACAPRLVQRLTQATEARGIDPVQLASGAGHDAMALAPLTDVAMLFVRCAGGVSHNPAESIRADDAETAAAVLLQFVRHFETS